MAWPILAHIPKWDCGSSYVAEILPLGCGYGIPVVARYSVVSHVIASHKAHVRCQVYRGINVLDPGTRTVMLQRTLNLLRSTLVNSPLLTCLIYELCSIWYCGIKNERTYKRQSKGVGTCYLTVTLLLLTWSTGRQVCEIDTVKWNCISMYTFVTFDH